MLGIVGKYRGSFFQKTTPESHQNERSFKAIAPRGSNRPKRSEKKTPKNPGKTIILKMIRKIMVFLRFFFLKKPFFFFCLWFSLVFFPWKQSETHFQIKKPRKPINKKKLLMFSHFSNRRRLRGPYRRDRRPRELWGRVELDFTSAGN